MTSSSNKEQREKLVTLPIVDYLLKTDIYSIVNYLLKSIKRLIENRTMLIALCDDSKLLRLQIKSLLVNQNIKFVEFFDGKEAFESIINQKLKVDLLITDVYMPKMDGTELIHKIRSRYNSSELPILALSSSDKSSLIAQLLKMEQMIILINLLIMKYF